MSSVETKQKPQQEVAAITIRFAGDSGDGMQLAGERFSAETALAGNDLRTFPDFPAEIRAPAGTLSGVSGFQISFGSQEVYTPGDAPDVLVAMNPAALKTSVSALDPGAIIILNEDGWTDTNIKKAGYDSDPLYDGSLTGYRVYPVPISRLNDEALRTSPLSTKQKGRCKNFFALGLLSWMYSRPVEKTFHWIQEKFSRNPDIAKANTQTFKAGYHFGETAELFTSQFVVSKAKIAPGLYRKISGNEAMALGCIAAAQRAGKSLVYASYPITPASDILHKLSQHKAYDVRTFQAEDEIAAVCAAIGASFAGALGVTGTSGPGLDLKGEAIGLAVMAELPLVIIDVQRGGPSTGLPTKTEQGDLLHAMFGRHGECPLVVLASKTPGDCFDTVYEAFRLATKYMTPVIVLSDVYLANGTEPWKIPIFDSLPKLDIVHPTAIKDDHPFYPYSRDEVTGARPWVIPGTPGLEHRLGGLEKEHLTGNVSYDPSNHERMVRYRAEKINGVTADIPPLTVHGQPEGQLLVIGWGSTYGAITAAVSKAQEEGCSVSAVHLRHLHPFPSNLGEILSRFQSVLVPELNTGQLRFLLRGHFLIDVHGLNKIQGQPFKELEILDAIRQLT
ncbi:2-oxoacid:acceptor oxidoreductase subunit alpha [Candidatus Nitronereus thalassa]|uniref:2-oxoacid:acceptor oxidoreductase subunit alpha n=1 Tax=Candidatus Nitronereus thalassa TaxID=3020898 RepID=A0ABU3K2Z5_9BACT|nr:2-oxoacid:acceptor oxidoreductase subunit alpha [Candidatus Nitronereus thalassa]MDT7040765.1 2-oxoacid:acceptor oxidoreductase subunit alpha [Candidatus Nitronereus thalassa]